MCYPECDEGFLSEYDPLNNLPDAIIRLPDGSNAEDILKLVKPALNRYIFPGFYDGFVYTGFVISPDEATGVFKEKQILTLFFTKDKNLSSTEKQDALERVQGALKPEEASLITLNEMFTERRKYFIDCRRESLDHIIEQLLTNAEKFYKERGILIPAFYVYQYGSHTYILVTIPEYKEVNFLEDAGFLVKNINYLSLTISFN